MPITRSTDPVEGGTATVTPGFAEPREALGDLNPASALGKTKPGVGQAWESLAGTSPWYDLTKMFFDDGVSKTPDPNFNAMDAIRQRKDLKDDPRVTELVKRGQFKNVVNTDQFNRSLVDGLGFLDDQQTIGEYGNAYTRFALSTAAGLTHPVNLAILAGTAGLGAAGVFGTEAAGAAAAARTFSVAKAARTVAIGAGVGVGANVASHALDVALNPAADAPGGYTDAALQGAVGGALLSGVHVAGAELLRRYPNTAVNRAFGWMTNPVTDPTGRRALERTANQGLDALRQIAESDFESPLKFSDRTAKPVEPPTATQVAPDRVAEPVAPETPQAVAMPAETASAATGVPEATDMAAPDTLASNDAKVPEARFGTEDTSGFSKKQARSWARQQARTAADAGIWDSTGIPELAARLQHLIDTPNG